MKRFDWRILWGILLVLGGIVFLMDNLNVINVQPLLNNCRWLPWSGSLSSAWWARAFCSTL